MGCVNDVDYSTYSRAAEPEVKSLEGDAKYDELSDAVKNE